MSFKAVFGIAGAALVLSSASSAWAGSKWQSALVRPPVTLDAGVDLDGDGTNDTVPIPRCQGSASPGAGDSYYICVGGQHDQKPCTPQIEGPDPCATGDPADCRPCQGPDGVTSADEPTPGRYILGKSKCSFSGSKLSLSAQFEDSLGSKKCTAEWCTSPTVTTGKCAGGFGAAPYPSFDGQPCTEDADCGDPEAMIGRCLDGNEWWVELDLLVGSNPDNTPPCDGNAQLAIRGGATTFEGAGHCTQGVRVNKPCQTDADCGDICTGGSAPVPPDAIRCVNDTPCAGFGATCPNAGACTVRSSQTKPIPLTGDEVCFKIKTPVGIVSQCPLCPISVRIDEPFRLAGGRGKLKTDLRTNHIGATIPSRKELEGEGLPDFVRVQVESCVIHEPGPVSKIWPVGMITGMNDDLIANSLRCADYVTPLGPSRDPMQNILGNRTAVGPIVGVQGVEE